VRAAQHEHFCPQLAEQLGLFVTQRARGSQPEFRVVRFEPLTLLGAKRLIGILGPCLHEGRGSLFQMWLRVLQVVQYRLCPHELSRLRAEHVPIESDELLFDQNPLAAAIRQSITGTQ